LLNRPRTNPDRAVTSLNLAEVATLDILRIFVSWDQQKRMDVAIRKHSNLGDLATIVDKGPIALWCQTRTGRQ
jgi:hypothetical protein